MDKYYTKYDKDTKSYYVFNNNTGNCYNSFATLGEAERVMKELNLTENYRKTEKMFGEDIFTYTYKGYIGDKETMSVHYLNVEFPFKSMTKYNGNAIIKDDDGSIRILNENVSLNNEQLYLWSGFIIDIPEFRQLLFNRYQEEK